MKENVDMNSEVHAADSMNDALVETLAHAVNPIELSAEQRDRMRKRMFKEARAISADGTTTIRARDGAWVQIAPNVEIRELRRDTDARTHTSLMRMHPGGVIPPHRHSQDEEFIILEGECHIGAHHLRVGDSHFAVAGSWHDAVTTKSGVLVMLRGEFPYPGEAR